jgi:hypothetical protein
MGHLYYSEASLLKYRIGGTRITVKSPLSDFGAEALDRRYVDRSITVL